MPAVSKRFISLGSLTFFFAFLLVSWCAPVEGAITPVGKVILTNGTFLAIQADSSSRSLTRGSEFYQGDRLWTGPNTKAQIRFSDGAIMTLRAGTEFRVDEYEFDEKNADRNKSLFTLIKGGFRTITGLVSRLKPENYRVKTSYAIVGVRGTTYETVVDKALYVAAWQGTVSVSNDAGEKTLGFGQDTNFARVTGFTRSPTGLLVTPPQLLESVDPGLKEAVLNSSETDLLAGYLRQGNDVRLSPSEVSRLNRVGAAVIGGVGAPRSVAGLATSGVSGSAVFLDVGQNVVAREGSAPAGVVAETTYAAGFTAELGDWNAPTATGSARLQDNPHDPGDAQGLNRPVYWISMNRPTSFPAAANYGLPATVVGSGSGGTSVSLVGLDFFSANVDFATGAVSGALDLSNGPNTWDTNFAGTVNGPLFNATLTGGSTVTTVSGTFQAVGDLNGGFAGPNAQAMGGVFDFEQAGNPSVHVEGAFLAN